MNKQLKDELMAGKVKIDELQSKLSLIERAWRQKDDDIFNMAKEIDQCKVAVSTYEQNEKAIKHEVIDIIQSRNQVEKEWQELRLQNSDFNVIIRQLSDKFESLSKNEAKYVTEIKLCRNQIEQLESYTSVLEFEKQKVEQKLQEEHETNLALQKMCSEILDEYGNDSDCNKIIIEKELELK